LIGSGLGARIISQKVMADQWAGSVCLAGGMAVAYRFGTHNRYG